MLFSHVIIVLAIEAPKGLVEAMQNGMKWAAQYNEKWAAQYNEVRG